MRRAGKRMTSKHSDFQIGKLIRLVAGIGVIGLLVQFALEGGPAELLRQLAAIQWHGWFVLCAMSVAVLAVLSRLFQISLQVINVRMPFPTAFDYSTMNNFFNSILPMQGGIWVRGMYLRKRFDISWASYLFVMASGQIIQLALLGTIAVGFYLSGQLPIYLPALPDTPVLAAALAVLALGIAVAIVRRKTVMEFAQKGARGFKLWTADPMRFARYVVEALIFHVLTGLRLWLAFMYVGTSLSVTEMCVLYAILAAGLSWAVTPGNIGVKEAAITILAVILGIDTGTAVAASIVDRIASLFVTLTIGGFAAYRVSSSTDASE